MSHCDQFGEFYRKHGFLVVENCFSPTEVAELNAETTALCRGDRGDIHGVTPALPEQSDEEVLKQYLCIHFPYKLSAMMRAQVAQENIVEILTRVIGPNVKSMQSMLFIKASGKPGQAWHQDEFYIPTRDRSLCGVWLALDDATVENGCLWIIPGSQQPGILFPMRSHDDRAFDCSWEAYEFPYRDDEAVPVEVKAGSVVVFNGYLLHRSLPNVAKSGYRRALVNHYMSAESLLPWYGFQEGIPWAQADYRDIIMVAGKDPYAYKGTADIARAHVRPSGEGGCAPTGNDEGGEDD